MYWLKKYHRVNIPCTGGYFDCNMCDKFYSYAELGEAKRRQKRRAKRDKREKKEARELIAKLKNIKFL